MFKNLLIGVAVLFLLIAIFVNAQEDGTIDTLQELKKKIIDHPVFVEKVAQTTQTITQTTNTTILQLIMAEGATAPSFQILNSDGEAVLSVAADGSTTFGTSSITIDATQNTMNAYEITVTGLIVNVLNAVQVIADAVGTAILVVTGNTYIGGNASIAGNVDVGGNLTIAGSTTLADLTADAINADSLTTIGNVDVGGNLTVAGATTLADLTADAINANSLTTIGDADIGGNLAVDGSLDVDGFIRTSIYTRIATHTGIPIAPNPSGYLLVRGGKFNAVFGDLLRCIKLDMPYPILLQFEENGNVIDRYASCPTGFGRILFNPAGDFTYQPSDVLFLINNGIDWVEGGRSITSGARFFPYTMGKPVLADPPEGFMELFFTLFVFGDQLSCIGTDVYGFVEGYTTVLAFAENVNVIDGYAGCPTDSSKILLDPSGDFSYEQGDVLVLRSDGTDWVEVSRILS